ncbi:MAG: GntR family transcriptional regulator [Candidatus Solibacter usitatus]|nr:GntR family transcriptional regulator [Candidatus Solibacter usitatus]
MRPVDPQQFRFRLDLASGVPVYRQLIDQMLIAISSDVLRSGDQLPTVREVAVELSINLNTVVRAYKELEIRGVLKTQQGRGTFITEGTTVKPDEVLRQRRLLQMVSELVARAGGEGFSVSEIRRTLQECFPEEEQKRN